MRYELTAKDDSSAKETMTVFTPLTLGEEIEIGVMPDDPHTSRKWVVTENLDTGERFMTVEEMLREIDEEEDRLERKQKDLTENFVVMICNADKDSIDEWVMSEAKEYVEEFNRVSERRHEVQEMRKILR